MVETRGATNMVEASLPSVVKCVSAMQHDPILQHFPFATTSFGEIVLSVIRSGTPLERAALAKHMTPEAAYFFPSASTMVDRGVVTLQNAIERIFKPMFGLLCDHFGVNFAGNMDTVAYSLMTQFGGLSFPDFLICFERVKNGQYHRDTQHIMTRGINVEFMTTWLTEYDAEREESRAAIYSQYHPENVRPEVDPNAAKRIAAINGDIAAARKSRDQVKRDADNVFTEWESALYTSGIFKQGFKWKTIEVNDLDVNGDLQYKPDATVVTKKVKQEMLCAVDDPECSRFEEYAIRVPKAGTINRKVKRIIYEFVTLGDPDAMNVMFDEFLARVFDRYDDEQNPPVWVESDLKTIISAFGTVKRQFPAMTIVEQVLRKMHPDAPANQITASARETIRLFEDQYFNEYLPSCIANKYPRLEIDEFLIANTLPEYVKLGFENPFKLLFK